VPTLKKAQSDGVIFPKREERKSKNMKNYSTKKFWRVIAPLLLFSTSAWAQAGSPSQVKEGFQYGLGLLFMVGFIWGVINIWGGADRLKKGDADGKMGIVSGIIIAAAAAIMAALFYIFGMADGTLTPQF